MVGTDINHTIQSVAGSGSASYAGDGGQATDASLDQPYGSAVDARGDLFIVDAGDNVIREVSPSGVITTVAGDGVAGFSGDGGPATRAELSDPTAVAVDSAGDLYIADFGNNRVRMVSPSGVITTIAGNGTFGDSGDNGPATAAAISGPAGIAVDAAGDVFLTDPFHGLVRKVSPSGVITTVAGGGEPGVLGDGGPATDATLTDPEGIAVDAFGDLFIADFGASRIREVNNVGIITTVAGSGIAGYAGDGGPAAAGSAQLNLPSGVAVDAAGNLFIADTFNRVIRGVAPDGAISTVAGNGAPIYFGDGGPALDASFDSPASVATDSAGDLFIADPAEGRIRRVANGITVTIAGMAPSSVYVAPAYASDAPLTPVVWSDGSTHYVGVDAFGTIQDAINAVASSGTVNVASGTYTEQLKINESLSILGAGASSTTIQTPASASGNEIEIKSGVTVTMSGLSMDGAGSSTAIDSNGADLVAIGIAITGYNVGVSVENGGAATITASTISNANTAILAGSGSNDTATLAANNDSFAGDPVGIQNNQTTGLLTAMSDWWGTSTGPTNASNPEGTGAKVVGSVNFSPWLGDAKIVAPDYLVFLATAGNAFVVTPSASDTLLGVSLSGRPVGTITGGGTISFDGTAATVTINGESEPGSTNVFTIQNTSVQYSAAYALTGTTINFLGTGMSRYVDAGGTTNTFNIRGSGASGPSGSLIGDSGANAFVFSGSSKLNGGIQGAGASTLNFASYSSAVKVNLGNGTNGTATGVSGKVAGINALVGSNFNDTLNAGAVPSVALTGGLGTNTLSGTGTGDSVVESLASTYTLTNTKLTGTGAGFTDNLTGITIAHLTGASTTSNAFTVSGWTGSGTLSAPAGTGTVTASKIAGYTLLSTSLSSTDKMTLGLSGITTANLTDTGKTHTFTITGWTGSGTLKGATENLVDSVATSVVLASTSLAVTGLPKLTLSGFTTANLADTAGGNTFTVSGWTGRGSLTDSAATADTVTASKRAGYTLTNSLLSSTDGMTLSLSGITTGNLTVTATTGSPSYIVDASAFTGVTNLTAGGTVNAVLFGGSANGGTLSATGSGNDVLIGGAGKSTLTDKGTGYNILIGGPGADTLTGNGNDILIGGTTSYDSNTVANIAALDAILAEWSSSDSYSLRISKIMNGVAPGGTDALNSSTCQSDGVANTVSDGAASMQNNWFIVTLKDKLTKKTNETVTIV